MKRRSLVVWGVYAFLLAMAITRHERWLDEAQAWLIGRDASLSSIWLHLAHYEGSPMLWHTLLHVLSNAGLPYTGLSIFAGMVACSGVYLLIRNAPLPEYLRYLLPFTYFLAYQYAVVARSYVLLPTLLFSFAILFPRREERPWLFHCILCLLAVTSVHGLILSFTFWLTSKRRLRPLPADAMYLIVVLVVLWTTWPAKDHEAISQTKAGQSALNLSVRHAVEVSAVMVRGALAGSWILSGLAVILSIPFLWKGGTLLPFALAAGGLGVFGAVVYANHWHQGIVFLAWLTCIWMGAYRAKVDRGVSVALVLVAAVQISWTVRTVRYDWDHNYSGSRAAATKLKEMGVGNGTRLYALGLASVSILPYFDRNVFENYSNPGAYWDWSVKNSMNDGIHRLSVARPDLVVVAIKGEPPEAPWKVALSKAGYLLSDHVSGALYWQNHPLEPEAFDIYRRAVTAVR